MRMRRLLGNSVAVALLCGLVTTNALAQTELDVSKIKLGAAPCTLLSGAGAPEGAIVGRVCDVYVRNDGSTNSTIIYVKISGTGNTGWVSAGGAGTGTIGTLAKWATTTTLGDSLLVESSSLLEAAASLNLGKNFTTGDAYIQIGQGRSGSGNSYIDLIGDATNTDFGLRLIRGNGGANAISTLQHRGTGNFNIGADDAGTVAFWTGGTERLRLNANGTFGLGYVTLFNSGIDGSGADSLYFANTGYPTTWRHRFQSSVSSTASNNWLTVSLTSGASTFFDVLKFTGNAESNASANFAADLMPVTGYTDDIGMLTKKWLTLHASELMVETLVAMDTQATIGGRVLVGETTTLTKDAALADGYLCVKHNAIASGDRLRMEASGKVEFLAATSGPTTDHASCNATVTDYYYTVTRNLDGSGANDWNAGDAVFNTGTTNDGFIDLYSIGGVISGSGPTVVGNVRTGTTYNQIAPRWAIGNLNGIYGYSGTAYGAAFGDAGGTNLTIDTTDGVRFRDSTTVLGKLASSTWTLGQVGASQSNVYITSGSVALRNNTTERIKLNADGSGFLASSNLAWNTSGVLTAGNWTIGASAITATNISLNSGAANTANITVGTGSTAGGLNSANAAGDIAIWAGSTFANRASAPFRVEADGSLVATDATISGNGSGLTSINGANITTGTITASKLTLSPGFSGAALNRDPNFLDSSVWSAYNVTTGLTDGKAGSVAMTNTSGSTLWPLDTALIPVDPTKTYRVHAWLRKVSGSGNDATYVWIDERDYAGNYVQDSYVTPCPTTYNPMPATWTLCEGEIGAGTGRTFGANTRYVRVGVGLNNGLTTSVIQAQDLRFEEKLPGSLIVNGAITADKISAGAITATKLAVLAGGGNLLHNSGFENVTDTFSDYWVCYDGGGERTGCGIGSATSHTGTYAYYISWNTATNVKGIYAGTKNAYKLRINTTYVLTFWARGSSAMSTPMDLGWNQGPQSEDWVENPNLTTSFQRYQVRFKTSAIAQDANAPYITIQNYSQAANILWIDDIQLEEGDIASNWNLAPDDILPGTIVTNRIATGAITTDLLAANSVTAGKISVTNLNAIKANTGALTVDGTATISTGGSLTWDYGIADKDGIRLDGTSSWDKKKSYSFKSYNAGMLYDTANGALAVYNADGHYRIGYGSNEWIFYGNSFAYKTNGADLGASGGKWGAIYADLGASSGNPIVQASGMLKQETDNYNGTTSCGGIADLGMNYGIIRNGTSGVSCLAPELKPAFLAERINAADVRLAVLEAQVADLKAQVAALLAQLTGGKQ
jgi:hypothetical protein